MFVFYLKIIKNDLSIFYRDYPSKMSFPLYHNNGNYYLLVDKGCSYSYVVEFQNFTSKLINNDDLNSYAEIELTRDNLQVVLTSVNKIANACLDDFDKFQYNHCIEYHGSTFYVNSWRDVMNIIKSR